MAFLTQLSQFPWHQTAATLRGRLAEDRLVLTAGSLTFTTIMALVPLVTVTLALFTAFPIFAKFQGVLQKWLLDSLVPDTIARQVLGYLTQFAGKASRLGGVGLAVLLVTALMLILTIDHTLNNIWRVRRPRPLGQRVLVYWAAMTLGPLLLGISLTFTSYAVSASRGLVSGMPGGVHLLVDVLQFLLMAGGMAALYHYVPNTQVRWSHAWAGGLLVSAGFELAKKLLVLYLGQVPTYSVLYGAFATVPILLIWIYVAWLIVLQGAVLTAHLPSLTQQGQRPALAHGWPFLLALQTLQHLARVRHAPPVGLTLPQLAELLRVNDLHLEPVLEGLCDMDWIGALQEPAGDVAARYVLLADPCTTPLAPLLDAWLVTPDDCTLAFRQKCQWSALKLHDALQTK